MDELELKANEIVDNIPAEKELARIIREEFEISNRKQIAFVIEYIKTNEIYKSYQAIYGSHISMNSAAVIGSRILKRIDMAKLLDYAGHGIDKLFGAMDKLYEDDPANYMKFQTKLRGLDQKKVEHSGSIEMPVINIVTKKD